MKKIPTTKAARLDFERGDYQAAVAAWSFLADHGDAEAMWWLSRGYEWGWARMERDSAKAEELWQRAVNIWQPLAESGDAEAQFWLGKSYDLRSYETALKWYQRAAEQGHTEAQFRVGRMYDDRWHRERRYPAKAVEWLLKAANKGHRGAQYWMGHMYDVGGLKQDYEEAYFWYSVALVTKAKLTRRIVANLTSEQTNRVKKRVEDWYLRAANEGNSWAQLRLGEMYERGWVLEQNLPESYFWYRLAPRCASSIEDWRKYGKYGYRVAAKLHPEQVETIKERVRKWTPTPKVTTF